MAQSYSRSFVYNGKTNLTLPQQFSLGTGFRGSTVPQWTSGRVDSIRFVAIDLWLKRSQPEKVSMHYSLTSGGITVSCNEEVEILTASGKSGAAYFTLSNLQSSDYARFIAGLPTATLTIDTDNTDVILTLENEMLMISCSFQDDSVSATYSLDKSVYHVGDRPILTRTPTDPDETGVKLYSAYWAMGAWESDLFFLEGNVNTLDALTTEFEEQVVGGMSSPLKLIVVETIGWFEQIEIPITVTFECNQSLEPSIAVTAEPTDGGSDYWQGYEGCILRFNANPANSTSKNLRVYGAFNYNGEFTESLTVPKFSSSGTKTFNIEYTNIRNQVATATVSIDVKTIEKPMIMAFEAQRYDRKIDDVGEAVYEWSLSSSNVRVRYAYNIDPAGGNVTGSDCSLKFKIGGTVIDVPITSLDGSVEYTNTADTPDKTILQSVSFPASTEQNIVMELSDGRYTVTSVAKIPKSRVNLHIAASDYGVGIGTFVEGTSAENPRFVCEYPAEFRNGIIGLNMEPKIVLDDRDSYNNANNALIIHDVTVEEAGWYFLQTNFEFGNNANGRRGFEVEVTGEVHSVPIALMLPPVNGDSLRGSAATFVHLYAGDVLHFRTYQTSGTTLAVGVGRRLIKLF